MSEIGNLAHCVIVPCENRRKESLFSFVPRFLFFRFVIPTRREADYRAFNSAFKYSYYFTIIYWNFRIEMAQD